MRLKNITLIIILGTNISCFAQTEWLHSFSFNIIHVDGHKVTPDEFKQEKLRLLTYRGSGDCYFSYDWDIGSFTYASDNAMPDNHILITSNTGSAFVDVDRSPDQYHMITSVITLKPDTSCFIIKHQSLNVCSEMDYKSINIWNDTIDFPADNKVEVKYTESKNNSASRLSFYAHYVNSYRLINVSYRQVPSNEVSIANCNSENKERDIVKLFYGSSQDTLLEFSCSREGFRIPKTQIRDSTWLLITKKHFNNSEPYVDSMLLFIDTKEEMYHALLDTISFQFTSLFDTIKNPAILESKNRNYKFMSFLQYAEVTLKTRYFDPTAYSLFPPGYNTQIAAINGKSSSPKNSLKDKKIKIETFWPNGQLSSKACYLVRTTHLATKSDRQYYHHNLYPIKRWYFYNRQGVIIKSHTFNQLILRKPKLE